MQQAPVGVVEHDGCGQRVPSPWMSKTAPSRLLNAAPFWAVSGELLAFQPPVPRWFSVRPSRVLLLLPVMRSPPETLIAPLPVMRSEVSAA